MPDWNKYELSEMLDWWLMNIITLGGNGKNDLCLLLALGEETEEEQLFKDAHGSPGQMFHCDLWFALLFPNNIVLRLCQ